MRNEKYKNQYERYDYLKKIHICTNCGNEESEPNSNLCLECKEKIYSRKKNYYIRNKKEINQKQKKYFKNLYYQRKEKGICTKCGKRKMCKNSTTLCLDCYVKSKRRKDKRWNNDIPRSERVAYGLCYICGSKRKEHNTLCDNCYSRSKNKMDLLNANPTNRMLDAREKYKNNMSNLNKLLFKKNTKNTN